MTVRNVLLAAIAAACAGALIAGCETPKVVTDSVKAGEGVMDVSQGATGTVAGAVVHGTAGVVQGVADGTGNIVKGASDATGGHIENATIGAAETAEGVGQTFDGVGKEMGKDRKMDVMGNEANVNLLDDKKIKMNF